MRKFTPKEIENFKNWKKFSLETLLEFYQRKLSRGEFSDEYKEIAEHNIDAIQKELNRRKK